MSENLSLKDGFELLVAGRFDNQLRRLSLQKQRRARRIVRRLKRGRYADEFYDELIPEMERDKKCCAAIPMLAAGTLEADTPLGWDSGQFFEFLDGILERLPSIIDAILSIITLFAALLLAVTLFSSSAVAEELPPSTPFCKGGQCPIVHTAVKTAAAPVRVADSLTTAIRAAWPNRKQDYAFMARGQEHLVKHHLVSEHGYTQSQVAPLSHSDAIKLHNLAHGPRVNSLIGGRQPGTVRATVRAPVAAAGNCANGQCARQPTQRVGLIGRLFGR